MMCQRRVSPRASVRMSGAQREAMQRQPVTDLECWAKAKAVRGVEGFSIGDVLWITGGDPPGAAIDGVLLDVYVEFRNLVEAHQEVGPGDRVGGCRPVLGRLAT